MKYLKYFESYTTSDKDAINFEKIKSGEKIEFSEEDLKKISEMVGESAEVSYSKKSYASEDNRGEWKPKIAPLENPKMRVEISKKYGLTSKDYIIDKFQNDIFIVSKYSNAVDIGKSYIARGWDDLQQVIKDIFK